jgi:hypothetical protein
VRKEQRTSSNGEGSGNGVLPKNTGTSRQNFQKSKLVDGDLTCRFTTASNGPGGTIYEAWLEGRVVVIEWNIDHPFYHRFVLENRDNPGVANAADYLVFSLACAELIHLNNDENIELMLNLRSVLSTNMRTLLS